MSERLHTLVVNDSQLAFIEKYIRLYPDWPSTPNEQYCLRTLRDAINRAQGGGSREQPHYIIGWDVEAREYRQAFSWSRAPQEGIDRATHDAKEHGKNFAFFLAIPL